MYNADDFDLVFVKIINELQKQGFAVNESELERAMNLSKRSIYKCKAGIQGISKFKRDYVKRFMRENYDVNVRAFVNRNEKLFQHDIPLVTAITSGSDKPTAGELIQLERLKDEVKHLREVVLLKDEIIEALKHSNS